MVCEDELCDLINGGAPSSEPCKDKENASLACERIPGI